MLCWVASFFRCLGGSAVSEVVGVVPGAFGLPCRPVSPPLAASSAGVLQKLGSRLRPCASWPEKLLGGRLKITDGRGVGGRSPGVDAIQQGRRC